MTNEEKALSLSQKYAAPKNKNREIAVYQSTLEMAEWKDSILREELDKAIERANAYYDKKLNQHCLAKYIGMVDVFSRLLGIPFPTHRLHMGFATMD